MTSHSTSSLTDGQRGGRYALHQSSNWDYRRKKLVGLNLVSDNVLGEKEFDGNVKDRNESEDDEEEENVVAVEDVIVIRLVAE
ncbi:hypothetical protein L2E82_08969 [Cichorium intybus]|uniref:Uncharacterized protein n=1 Tax=Cichorium intybus TaxID=13427 RepID=A0ACB9G7W0_CICIN|nr:hypothetical protein L2E82_08969 [Cichorium intybus]